MKPPSVDPRVEASAIGRRVGHGVVEGFYGKPWSYAERAAFVELLGAIGLQTFIIAPKNDPRGFTRPRSGKSDFDDVAKLAAIAKRSGVRLFVTSSMQNVARLVDVGVDGIVVSFDDTWTTFAPSFATFARGRAHGELAREAARNARDPRVEVLVVPAIYHRRFEDLGAGALAYLRGVSEGAAGAPVAWTGPAIFSRSITPGDARRLANETGLRLWVWNNAIANDWLPLATGEVVGMRPREKLSFGSVDNMSAGLEDAVEGIVLNAAREPWLSRVSARCFAEWIRDPLHYAGPDAHQRAIEAEAGSAAPVLALAHDLTCRHPFAAPSRFEGQRVASLIEGYRRDRVRREDLLDALREIVAMAERARTESLSREIVRECEPTLMKARDLALAASVALELAGLARKASTDSGSTARRIELEAALEAHLRRARARRWQVGLDAIYLLLRDAKRRRR